MTTPSSAAEKSAPLPAELRELCEQLRKNSVQQESTTQASPHWPAERMQSLASAGVFTWFLPSEYGGVCWDEAQIIRGYLALSQACLTSTFILTQWNAACKRILSSQNTELKQRLLPRMASGELFATVGISHLTTSRQHVAKPVLQATAIDSEDAFILDGMSPWVTAAAHADIIVTGATLTNGEQILVAVERSTKGVKAHPGTHLLALSGSCTDRVEFNQVKVSKEDLIAGPVANVLSAGSGGGAGGLQTSTLAIGLSMAAVRFLEEQAAMREELRTVANKLRQDCSELQESLLKLAVGDDANCSSSDLRQQANSFVLRATQASLTAAKGAGFIATHPTGRWAAEALFFLVWSCPQPVANANLCELAQIEA